MEGYEVVTASTVPVDQFGEALSPPPNGGGVLIRDVKGEPTGFSTARIKAVRLNPRGGTLNRFQAVAELLAAGNKPVGDRSLAWMARCEDEFGQEEFQMSQGLRATGMWFISASIWVNGQGKLVSRGFGNDPDEQKWDDNHWFELALPLDAHYAMLCHLDQ